MRGHRLVDDDAAAGIGPRPTHSGSRFGGHFYPFSAPSQPEGIQWASRKLFTGFNRSSLMPLEAAFAEGRRNERPAGFQAP